MIPPDFDHLQQLAEQCNEAIRQHRLPTMPQLVRALKLTSFRDLAAWAGLKYEPSPFRRNGETVPV